MGASFEEGCVIGEEIRDILKIEKVMSKLEASFSVCYNCNICLSQEFTDHDVIGL